MGEQEMKPIIFICIFTLTIIALVVYNHERTHAQIDEYYGCMNISYRVNLQHAFTYADYCPPETRAEMMLAHSNNEVVGYNIMPVLVIIAALLLVLLLRDEL